MVDFAQKLMTAAQVWSSDVPSTSNPIARNVLNRQKATYRIGMWPITSGTESHIGVGMGIGLTLAALLEQWPSVSVYRLMTQIDDDAVDYQWKIEDTQFGVDDWEVDGLDENVAIWGSFVAQDNLYRLSLEVEDDARQDDDVFELNYESPDLAGLINLLPVLATKIMKWLNDRANDLPSTYDISTAIDEEAAKNFLEDTFLWEVDYFLELWGQGSSNEQVLDSQSNLIELANVLETNFGAWLLSQTIARYIVFDQTNWSNWLLPTVKDTASLLGKYPVAAKTLATALLRTNENLEAFDVLENNLTLHPEDKESWLELCDTYMQSTEDLSAINVCQRAIEADAASADLYLRYAMLMDTLVEHQIVLSEGTNRVSAAGRPFVEQYIFADVSEESPSLRESCEAYQHVVEMDPSNVDALAHLVIGLLSLNDPEAWNFCAQLVEKDREGIATASVIEQLDDSDMKPMLKLLKAASAKTPMDVGLHLNIARVYIALGESNEAKRELDMISNVIVPPQMQTALIRLRVSADEPEFDARIGEIQDILDAKGQVNSEDVDFLEAIVEKEPLLSEGYRLLARSYLSWYESDDALEVLLDGQKLAPFDPELIALLAQVLWDADERNLAFAYLEQGLANSDHNATLLSLMGRFLFENGEDDEAKEYLRRAETADPLNAELSATRSYIANTLIRNTKSTDE